MVDVGIQDAIEHAERPVMLVLDRLVKATEGVGLAKDLLLDGGLEPGKPSKSSARAILTTVDGLIPSSSPMRVAERTAAGPLVQNELGDPLVLHAQAVEAGTDQLGRGGGGWHVVNPARWHQASDSSIVPLPS